MLRRLHRICHDDHVHQPLLGGRAGSAAFYPLPLLRAILEGMTDTAYAENVSAGFTENEYDVSLTMSVAQDAKSLAVKSSEPKAGELPKQDGGTVKVHYALNDFRETYLDEYTREPLPHALVRDAIAVELNYFNNRVWELVDANKILGDKDATVIRTRWVITDKGDSNEPDIRARLVAQEINTFKHDDVLLHRLLHWRQSGCSYRRWPLRGACQMDALSRCRSSTSRRRTSMVFPNGGFTLYFHVKWASDQKPSCISGVACMAHATPE